MRGHDQPAGPPGTRGAVSRRHHPQPHPSQRRAPAALEERGRHGHHEQAHGWFAASQELGWATCPLTQNAVLRLLGQPRYPNSPGSPAVEAGQLTDTYLLALAVHHGGTHVSFDRRLGCEAVTGGRCALRLIAT